MTVEWEDGEDRPFRDYEAAGFANRIPFDLYSELAGRGRYNEQRLRAWVISKEDEMFDTVIATALDNLAAWYEDETGDGT